MAGVKGVDMEVGLWGAGNEYSVVVGGVGFLLRRFLTTSHTLMAAARAMMATPPSTPPTMAPIGGELSWVVGVGVGVGGGVVVVVEDVGVA